MQQQFEKMDDYPKKDNKENHTYDEKENIMEKNNLDTSDVLLYRGLGGGQ